MLHDVFVLLLLLVRLVCIGSSMSFQPAHQVVVMAAMAAFGAIVNQTVSSQVAYRAQEHCLRFFALSSVSRSNISSKFLELLQFIGLLPYLPIIRSCNREPLQIVETVLREEEEIPQCQLSSLDLQSAVI